MAQRLAVKVAYEGSIFEGSARQPGRRTVEGELLAGLIRGRIIRDARSARFQAASRTDRGVSAAGNVVAFQTEAPPVRVLPVLNAMVPLCFSYGIAGVPSSFNPRHATERWYRYMLPRKGLDMAAIRHGAILFQGIHDFARFCRADGKGTIRSISSIEVRRDGRFLLIDLTAESFLWNMVRRIVGALVRIGQGHASDSDIKAALEGRGKANFGLASPEGLILMDVVYDDVRFAIDPRTQARVEGRLEESTNRVEGRQLHLEGIWMGLNAVTGSDEASDEFLE